MNREALAQTGSSSVCADWSQIHLYSFLKIMNSVQEGVELPRKIFFLKGDGQAVFLL